MSNATTEPAELDAVLRHAEQLRRVRNTALKRAMEAVENAASRVANAQADGLKALADQQAAEVRLATLLERGERKVIHNSLVTVEQDGALRIEHVEIVGLL